MRTSIYNLLAMGILIAIANLGFSAGQFDFSPTAEAGSQRLVSLYADGQKRVFSSDAPTVGEVIQRAGLKLGQHDLVEPAADEIMPDEGPYNINIYRARPVLVIDGAKTHRVMSAYQSPRLLATAAGLNVFPEDTYGMEVITDIVEAGSVGEQVTIQRATPVNIKVDGRMKTIRTQADTVSQALDEAGITLGMQDTMVPAAPTEITPGSTVVITRVSEVTATLTQTLARPTKTINDPSLLKGTTQIKEPGADGQKTASYRIHYQDGKETSRQLLQVISQTEPKAKEVVLGTKVFFAGSVEYWRPQVEAAAAAYGIDPNMMLRIMDCESNGDATVTSHFIVNGEHPTGLFQYLPSTWRSAGGTNDNIFDGALQIKLTAKKMAAQGTRAWQCQ